MRALLPSGSMSSASRPSSSETFSGYCCQSTEPLSMSNSAKSTASMNYITACNHALARENRRGRSLGAARKKLSEKLRQLPSTAAHEPGETTTCAR